MGTIPKENRYTRDHEWVELDKPKGTVTVGITQYAAEKLGEVVFVELPEVAADFYADEPFGTVESTKAVSDLLCPIAGTVIEVNDALLDNPELVSDDPFDEGWLIKLQANDPGDIDGLMSAEEYEALIEGLDDE